MNNIIPTGRGLGNGPKFSLRHRVAVAGIRVVLLLWHVMGHSLISVLRFLAICFGIRDCNAPSHCIIIIHFIRYSWLRPWPFCCLFHGHMGHDIACL